MTFIKINTPTMDNLLPKPPREALFVYTIFLLSLCSVIKAQPTFLDIDCPNATLPTTPTYAQNSTYQRNLNTLLSDLSSNSNASNGFFNFTAGSRPPDIAYGLFLCRGDLSAAACQECVGYASKDVVKRCPRSKQVTIWYDPCMLRYSNESFFSTPDVEFPRISRNPQRATNGTLSREVLRKVMDDIAARASSDDSGKKFATAEAQYSPLEYVYGLGQCTPDLSDYDCNNCLRNCISNFPGCCAASQGARVLLPSCYVLYEMYPFYNDSVSASPPPPSPLLPPPPPPSGPGKMITIVVSVSASVVLALLGSGIYYQRRRKRTAKEVQLLNLAQGRIVDDYSTGNLQGEKPTKSHDFPSVQLGLILVATKNFSQENKLGEGGFGPVYKLLFPYNTAAPPPLSLSLSRPDRQSLSRIEPFPSVYLVRVPVNHKQYRRRSQRGYKGHSSSSSPMQSPSSQRTPSRSSPRGKGKATTDRPRARQRLQVEERAHWTSNLTKDFLQCCANDIDQFLRTSNSLDPAGWVRVNDAFNTMTNSNYNKAQLKNRWDQLKRDWAAWIMLTESPNQTGLGWDKEKNTVTAPDHWWGSMIIRRKEAAKFREAGLEHRDLMERVFRNVTAMGEGAYIPRTRQQQMEDVAVEESQELESEGTNLLVMEDPFQTPMKRYKSGGGGTTMPTGTGSHGSTRKSSASKVDLSGSINELLEHVKHDTEEVEKGQRTEAIRRVKALPIFRDMADQQMQALRWWTLRHLEKMRKVEAFLACDTDTERHYWLHLENVNAAEAYRKGLCKEPLPPPTFPPPSD